MADLSYAIEPVRPEDAWEIAKLVRTTWLATYPNEEFGVTAEDVLEATAPRFRDAAIEAREEQLAHLGQDIEILTVKHEGHLIGVSVASKRGGRFKIKSLYVDPAFQNQGIGTQLMEQMLDWLGRDHIIELTVASYNETAIKFYQRFGFAATGPADDSVNQPLPSGKNIPEIRMVRIPAD